jgi:hypothetical protein
MTVRADINPVVLGILGVGVEFFSIPTMVVQLPNDMGDMHAIYAGALNLNDMRGSKLVIDFKFSLPWSPFPA